MVIDNVMAVASFAIDSNGDSRLLADIENNNQSMVTESQQLVPPASAIYSLFSENSLLLNQD